MTPKDSSRDALSSTRPINAGLIYQLEEIEGHEFCGQSKNSNLLTGYRESEKNLIGFKTTIMKNGLVLEEVCLRMHLLQKQVGKSLKSVRS